MDYFDSLRIYTQDAISRVLLKAEPDRASADWLAKSREIATFIPPAELLIRQEIINSLKSPYIPNPRFSGDDFIEIYPTPLPPDIKKTLVNLLSETPDYVSLKTIDAQLKNEIDNLLIHQNDTNPDKDLWLNKDDIDAFLGIATGEKTILVPILNRLKESLESSTTDNGEITDITIERSTSLIKLMIQKRIQEKYHAKITREQARLSRQKERLQEEVDIYNQQKLSNQNLERHYDIDRNIKYELRSHLTFPDLANNPDAGSIYDQRRLIAENITTFYALAKSNNGQFSSKDFGDLFHILERNIPDLAKSYLPRPSDISDTMYSFEDYCNLYFSMINHATGDGNHPINRGTPLGNLLNDLNGFLSDRTVDVYDEKSLHPNKLNLKTFDQIRNKVISTSRHEFDGYEQLRYRHHPVTEQADDNGNISPGVSIKYDEDNIAIAREYELDNIELLMKEIYRKPRPILSHEFFKDTLEPIFFPSLSNRAIFALNKLLR